MQNGIAYLQDLRRLISEDGFVLAVFAVVVVAAVLAFGFDAPPGIVAAVLVVGTLTVFAEGRLRARR
jgi:H+/Cl- antiporter ClcA